MKVRIEAGMMDGLHWFTLGRAQKATSPDLLLDNAKSVVVLSVPYWHGAPVPASDHAAPRGRISRYAWGRDYHAVLRKHLRTLAAFLNRSGPGAVTRAMVDYGPLAERAYGARAGLGLFGKSTNLLVPGSGSWVFLADLVTTVELEPDAPLRKTCGGCTRCIPACPTNAILNPYVVDSRRCISYLTIEHKGPIDRELRPLMGDWIFGCDLCQDVCPVNKRSHVRGWSEFRPRSVEDSVPVLIPLLSLSEEEFRERYRGRPIRRAKRSGFLRNVCIALGNIGDRAAVVPLVGTLSHDDPLVRGHAAWALGRLGGAFAKGGLERAHAVETDRWVREEIELALETIGAASPTGLAKRFHREILGWLESGGGADELLGAGTTSDEARPRHTRQPSAASPARELPPAASPAVAPTAAPVSVEASGSAHRGRDRDLAVPGGDRPDAPTPERGRATRAAESDARHAFHQEITRHIDDRRRELEKAAETEARQQAHDGRVARHAFLQEMARHIDDGHRQSREAADAEVAARYEANRAFRELMETAEPEP